MRMWARRTWAWGVAVLALSALVAGCSGEQGGTAAPTGAATGLSTQAATFGGELTALRTDYERELVAVQELGRQALDDGVADADDGEGGILDVYARMLAITRDAHQQYAALTPPAELEATHGRLVELLGAQADALERVIAAADAQDDTGLTEALRQLAVLIGDWATTNHALQRELDSTA